MVNEQYIPWLFEIDFTKFVMRNPLFLDRLLLWRSGYLSEREREREIQGLCKSIMFFASIFREVISRHHFQCSTGVNTHNSPNPHGIGIIIFNLWTKNSGPRDCDSPIVTKPGGKGKFELDNLHFSLLFKAPYLPLSVLV